MNANAFRMAEAMDRLDVGLAVFDEHDRLVSCNRAYRNGFEPCVEGGEVVGRSFQELLRAKLDGGGLAGKLASTDPEAWLRDRLATRERGGEGDLEIHLSDGRWLRVRDVALSEGGWINWWTDITETKAMAYQVDAMIESAGQGFAMWDQAGRLTRFNSRFRERFSADDGEPRVGETAAEIYARLAESGRLIFDEDDAADDWVGRRLAERRNAVSWALLSFADDSHLLMEERRAGDGSTVTVLVDVTELKRREQSLKLYGTQLENAISDLEFSHAYLEDHGAKLASMTEELAALRAETVERAQELERSNADLQQFAYVASHDLREPLRMVSSYVQLLEKRYGDQLDADAHDFIRYASDGAKRMDALIKDLLQYSRVQTHGQDFSTVESGAVLQEALDNLRSIVEEASGVVTVDRLPKVKADRLQILQLFQNLVGNALKYHSSDRAPEIHVTAEVVDEVATFRIRDNGIGIASEYFDRIFVIFQRLHGRREYSGTGVGLAVCKRIVERHGGRIGVESEPGNGSTFWFTLPVVG